MKKLIAFFLAASIFFCSSGCLFNSDNPYPYSGKHKELYTTAIYSIPDAEGYMHHGEGAFTSDIHIWEQDEYGRTLFSYCEDYADRIFALVICQAFDEENVYFYPDTNYVLTVMDSDLSYHISDADYLKTRTEAFYLENREQLKQENDWNTPLDQSKCVSYPITDHKTFETDALPLSAEQCNEILTAYSEKMQIRSTEKSPYRYSSILQVDAEGKILHQIRGVHRNYYKSSSLTIVLWVITDQDGNYDKENGILAMYCRVDSSGVSFVYDPEEILAFKNRNGWKYNHE